MTRIDDDLRALLLAYERLDASWRRGHSFTANEKLVIVFLAADGPLGPTELSQYVGLTTAGMSALLDRLEEGGYVSRARKSDDRRRVLVTLTKKGAQARFEFDRALEAVSMLDGEFPPEHRTSIRQFLAKASRILNDQA